MKQRAARRRMRSLIVCRRGGWGPVLYVNKRAYACGYFSAHEPASAADLSMTAKVANLFTVPAMHYSVKSARYSHLVHD